MKWSNKLYLPSLNCKHTHARTCPWTIDLEKFRLCQTWTHTHAHTQQTQSIVRFFFCFFSCYFHSVASYSISLNSTNLIVIWSQIYMYIIYINWLEKEKQKRRHTDFYDKQRKKAKKKKNKNKPTQIWNNHLIHSMALFQKWLKIDVTPTFFISMKTFFFSKEVLPIKPKTDKVSETKNCPHNPHQLDGGQFLVVVFICQLRICSKSNRKFINYSRWMSKVHALIVLSQHKNRIQLSKYI